MPFPATPEAFQREVAQQLKKLGGARWANAAERRRVAQQVRDRYWKDYGPDMPRRRPSQWIAGPQALGPLPGQEIYTVVLSYGGTGPVIPLAIGVYSDPMKANAGDVAQVLNELEEDP
jgi:hypothetical protein